jgi:hypothetical protein
MASKKSDPKDNLKDAIKYFMRVLIHAVQDGESLDRFLKKDRRVPGCVDDGHSYAGVLAQELPDVQWMKPYADEDIDQRSFYISVCGVCFKCVVYDESFENQGFLVSLEYEPEDLDWLRNHIAYIHELLTQLFCY